MLNVGRISWAQPPASLQQDASRYKKIHASTYSVHNGEVVTRSHIKMPPEASKHSARTKYLKTFSKESQENLTPMWYKINPWAKSPKLHSLTLRNILSMCDMGEKEMNIFYQG